LDEQGSYSRRKVYGHWKHGQATQEDYTDAAHHCKEKIYEAKAQLGFRLSSTVEEQQKEHF